MFNGAEKIENIITYDKEKFTVMAGQKNLKENGQGQASKKNSKKKKEFSDNTNGIVSEENGKKSSFKSKIYNHPIFTSVVSAAIIALFTLLLNSVISLKLMDYRLQTLETSIKEDFGSLQASVDSVNNDLNKYREDTNKLISELRHDLGILEGKVSIIESSRVSNVAYIDQSSKLGQAIMTNYEDYTTVHALENQKVYSGFDKYVATDINTGVDYTFPDLEGKTIIMSYKENEDNVYFKGQFDENGYWDGSCLINKYNKENLSMIMDAVYESGKLISYKQVFPYKTLSDNDVWVVSNREVLEEDVRSGETVMYFRNGEYIKSFDDKEILDTDFINTESFKSSIELQIEGYYNGYTSEGKFNDSSKDAYLVKYNKNGDVRYLYVGAIKDGLPNDNSGQAWLIIWGDANDGYHYYKGKFNGGKHDTPDEWTKPISQEQIDSIVDPNKFNCSLQGLISEDV